MKMTPSASPYAVFRAEEWAFIEAQLIGISQYLRLSPKKLSPIKKGCRTSLKKSYAKKHVQLAFA